MDPIVKWPDDKTAELPVILDAMPTEYDRYFEPFVGDGALFFTLEHPNSYVNDASADLSGLYRIIGDADRHDTFGKELHAVYTLFAIMTLIAGEHAADFAFLHDAAVDGRDIPIDDAHIGGIVADVLQNARDAEAPEYVFAQGKLAIETQRNVLAKVRHIAKLEATHGKLSQDDLADNYECALKASVYMAMRNAYNDDVLTGTTGHAVAFYFVREYCYSSMFRYNKDGKFNVPYGGISYNRKNFGVKMRHALSADVEKLLAETVIGNEDFEAFLRRYSPNANDFVFLDPPYDTEFSTYDRNAFTYDDQKRLARWCMETPAMVMLVVKDTPLMRELYTPDKFTIGEFGKTYQASFKARNEHKVKYLLITNYRCSARVSLPTAARNATRL